MFELGIIVIELDELGLSLLELGLVLLEFGELGLSVFELELIVYELRNHSSFELNLGAITYNCNILILLDLVVLLLIADTTFGLQLRPLTRTLMHS